MNERRKQREFIKTMLNYECDGRELETWQNRIHHAEKEEQCVSSSLRLVFLIFLLSVCGLGYCRLFLNSSMIHSPQLLIKVFFALVVACGFCFLVFGCLWFYYRHVTNRVCAEGRQHLMSIAQSRSNFIYLSHSDSESARSRSSAEAAPPCADGLAKVA
jgi:hypothetical protein